MGREGQKVKQKKIKLHPEEIRIARREILDFVLRNLQQVLSYWNFKYRDLICTGVGLGYDSKIDVGKNEEGLVLVLLIQVYIPEEVWIKLAELKKRRGFKLPKEHPLIRQRFREMEEVARESIEVLEKELIESGGEIEGEVVEGVEGGEGG